jgi:hypothetical protein
MAHAGNNMSSKIPAEYLDLSNDFGFTAVHESDVADPLISEANQTADSKVKEKLASVEKLILPLLVNLMKNPDKDYIHWPNRIPLIEKQIERILAITRS